MYCFALMKVFVSLVVASCMTSCHQQMALNARGYISHVFDLVHLFTNIKLRVKRGFFFQLLDLQYTYIHILVCMYVRHVGMCVWPFIRYLSSYEFSLVESYVEFLYLGTTLTNQNYIHEEILSTLKPGNACYYSVQTN